MRNPLWLYRGGLVNADGNRFCTPCSDRRDIRRVYRKQQNDGYVRKNENPCARQVPRSKEVENECCARTAEQAHAAESLGETLRETLGGRKLTWPSGARALGDCHSGGVMMEGKEGDVLVVNASQLMPTLVGQEEDTTWTECQGSSSHMRRCL